MMTTVSKALELLEDMAFENPPPQEKWFKREDFDPMHGLSELRYAAKLGRIELDDKDPEDIRFRFAPKGRAFLTHRNRG